MISQKEHAICQKTILLEQTGTQTHQASVRPSVSKILTVPGSPILTPNAIFSENVETRNFVEAAQVDLRSRTFPRALGLQIQIQQPNPHPHLLQRRQPLSPQQQQRKRQLQEQQQQPLQQLRLLLQPQQHHQPAAMKL